MVAAGIKRSNTLNQDKIKFVEVNYHFLYSVIQQVRIRLWNLIPALKSQKECVGLFILSVEEKRSSVMMSIKWKLLWESTLIVEMKNPLDWGAFWPRF